MAASIGPYGASLADGSEYRGHYGISRQQLADYHGPRLAAVMTAGIGLPIVVQRFGLALFRQAFQHLFEQIVDAEITAVGDCVIHGYRLLGLGGIPLTRFARGTRRLLRSRLAGLGRFAAS